MHYARHQHSVRDPNICVEYHGKILYHNMAQCHPLNPKHLVVLQGSALENFKNII